MTKPTFFNRASPSPIWTAARARDVCETRAENSTANPAGESEEWTGARSERGRSWGEGAGVGRLSAGDSKIEGTEECVGEDAGDRGTPRRARSKLSESCVYRYAERRGNAVGEGMLSGTTGSVKTTSPFSFLFVFIWVCLDGSDDGSGGTAAQCAASMTA